MNIKSYLSFYSFIFLLLITQHTMHAIVNPIPGENLWRMVSRIGLTVDTIEQTTYDTESMLSDTHCKVVDLFLKFKDQETAIKDLSSNGCTCDHVIHQEDIDGGLVITRPGVWCLAEDVYLNDSSMAINIRTDFVVLDLCGHTISGRYIQDQSCGITIEDRTNVTVKNGTIKNFNGIPLKIINSRQIKVDHLDINGAAYEGIIVVGNSRDIIFSHCNVTNTESYGIILRADQEGASVEQCILEHCTVSNSNQAGIMLYNDALNNCILDCKSFNNNGPGFYIDGDKNIIKGCVASNNDSDGFLIEGNFNKIISCFAFCNDSDGFCNDGYGNGYYNNIATQNSDDNFDSVGPSIVVPSYAISENTGFWANISCEDVE